VHNISGLKKISKVVVEDIQKEAYVNHNSTPNLVKQPQTHPPLKGRSQTSVDVKNAAATSNTTTTSTTTTTATTNNSSTTNLEPQPQFKTLRPKSSNFSQSANRIQRDVTVPGNAALNSLNLEHSPADVRKEINSTRGATANALKQSFLNLKGNTETTEKV